MQFVFNARGYELAVAFRKKAPGPHVVVSQGMNIHVKDVAEVLAYMESRPGQ